MTQSIVGKQSNQLIIQAFGDELRTQLEEILSLGKAAGSDLVEIYLEKSDNISLLAEQENISNVSPSFGICLPPAVV